jgi:preprotein translocase subunit SecE
MKMTRNELIANTIIVAGSVVVAVLIYLGILT